MFGYMGNCLLLFHEKLPDDLDDCYRDTLQSGIKVIHVINIIRPGNAGNAASLS